jgi:uncharacterized protein YcbK (DUF882 family)
MRVHFLSFCVVLLRRINSLATGQYTNQSVQCLERIAVDFESYDTVGPNPQQPEKKMNIGQMTGHPMKTNLISKIRQIPLELTEYLTW